VVLVLEYSASFIYDLRRSFVLLAKSDNFQIWESNDKSSIVVIIMGKSVLVKYNIKRENVSSKVLVRLSLPSRKPCTQMIPEGNIWHTKIQLLHRP